MIETILNAVEKIPYLLEVFYTIIILLLAYIINKIVVRKWIHKIARKAKVKDTVFKPLKNIVSAGVYVVALFLILRVFGMLGSLQGLLAGAGFAGIVVGFAAKDIMANFIGGIILFLDNDFHVGDVVEVGGVVGVVEDIEIRTTCVRTWDGEKVIIPNAMATNEIIKNRSVDKTNIRLRLPIGVAYGTDIDKVIKVCDKLMASFDEIEKDPKPQVVFEEFGSSSLNFELRFWIDFGEVSPPDLKTKVSSALQKELKKEGIGIPFPHVEVIMKK